MPTPIRPEIPAVEGVKDDKVTRILGPVKTILDTITGRTPQRPLLKTLGTGATLQGVVGKTNEIINRIQESDFPGSPKPLLTTASVTSGGTSTAGGTVTTVGLVKTLDATISVAGSPVTAAGTFTLAAVNPGADAVVVWSSTGTQKQYAALGAGLSLTSGTLNVAAGTSTSGGTVTNVGLAKTNDATITIGGSPITTAGTATIAAVDPGTNSFVVWQTGSGKSYVPADPSLNFTGTSVAVGKQPYDIGIQLVGQPTSAMRLALVPFSRTVVYGTAFVPSQGIARSSASSTSDFPIVKNGTTTIGSIHWGAGGTTATFISTATTTFSLGDVLEVFASTGVDGHLGDFGLVLSGTRT